MARDWYDDRGREDDGRPTGRPAGPEGGRRFGPSEGRGYDYAAREGGHSRGGYGEGRRSHRNEDYADRMYDRPEGGMSEDGWSGGRDANYTRGGGSGAREVFGPDADYGGRRRAPGFPRYGEEVGYLDRGYGSERPYPGERPDSRMSGGTSSGYGGYGVGRQQSGYGAGAPNNRGRAPKGYQRSDDRIREDVHDRLADDGFLDASNIEVRVTGGEVTLDGTVDSRFAKRHAEDLVEAVSGVNHCQNNLRVRPSGERAPGGGETAATLSHAESVLSGLSDGGQYSGLEGASGSGPDGNTGQTTAFSGKKTDLADRNRSS